MQRLRFKEVKKQIAEILQKDGDETRVNKLLEEFADECKVEEENYRLNKVKVIDESEPAAKMLFTDDSDLKFFEKYYNLVYLKRPEMTKEEREGEISFDFPIDSENYNPWEEYKNIFSGIYKKGKIHWLLSRMPEWKFLQIGETSSMEDITTNPVFDLLMTSNDLNDLQK